MTQVDLPFQLTGFERVDAVPGKALLRITGRGAGDLGSGRLALRVHAGTETHRVMPLPAPPAPAGMLRAGFTVAAEVADGAERFELELGGGEVAALPEPARRQTTRITPPLASLASGPGAPRASEAVQELNRRLAEERAKRASAETAAAASAAARQATVERFQALESELGSVRSDAEAARTEAAAARSQADSLRSALEAARNELRAAHGAAELGRTQANHARAEADAAEAALTRRDAEIDLLRTALQERETRAEADHAHWEQITAELTAEIELARADAIDYQQYASELELQLADLQAELEARPALSAGEGPADPEELRRALNAAAAELERLRAQG